MAANIQLDEGSSGKYTETEEVTTNVHRQAVKVAGVSACRLVKGGAVTQTITCTTANTDYTITNALAATTKYLVLYCANPFTVAMGEATSATCGPTLAAGTWTFPVAYTGVAADDKLHAQSSVALSAVRVTEMSD